MKRLLFIIFTLILGIIHSQAQEGNNISISKDSVSVLTKKELRKQKTANRNLHYNILGGPSYSPDFGLLIPEREKRRLRMEGGIEDVDIIEILENVAQEESNSR